MAIGNTLYGNTTPVRVSESGNPVVTIVVEQVFFLSFPCTFPTKLENLFHKNNRYGIVVGIIRCRILYVVGDFKSPTTAKVNRQNSTGDGSINSRESGPCRRKDWTRTRSSESASHNSYPSIQYCFWQNPDRKPSCNIQLPDGLS